MDEIVITGVGAVWGNVDSLDAHWSALVSPNSQQSGKVRLGPATVLPVSPSIFERIEQRRIPTRSAAFAVHAAEMAYANAGRPSVDPSRAGVVIGTAANGLIEHVVCALGPTDPFLASKATGSKPASDVARALGWHGACWSTGTACSAGNDAIAVGCMLISAGILDVVMVGGTEAPLLEHAVESFARLEILAVSGYSTPFANDSAGFLLGEGAACLLLERRVPGFERHGGCVTVSGFASTCDAFHAVRQAPDGEEAARSIRLALQQAHLAPADIRCYYAHGTGTHSNNQVEVRVIQEVCPEAPVIATKGTHGHPFGASAAIEAVTAVEAVRRRCLPPIDGLTDTNRDLSTVDFVQVERDWEPGPVVSVSFGLGGVNTAVVFCPSSR